MPVLLGQSSERGRGPGWAQWGECVLVLAPCRVVWVKDHILNAGPLPGGWLGQGRYGRWGGGVLGLQAALRGPAGVGYSHTTQSKWGGAKGPPA